MPPDNTPLSLAAVAPPPDAPPIPPPAPAETNPPAGPPTRINAAGLALVKEFEGLVLVAAPCPAGVPTVGWGHTGPDVHNGLQITQTEAERLLDIDMRLFEREVAQVLQSAGVLEKTSENQFSAFVSFAFNVGSGGFKKSTVLRKHLAGDLPGAAQAFLLWNKAAGSDGQLHELKGLTRRRAAEAHLYLTPTAESEAADPQRTRSDVVKPPPSPATAPTVAAVTGGGAMVAATHIQDVLTTVKGVWAQLADFAAALGVQAAHVPWVAAGLGLAFGGWHWWSKRHGDGQANGGGQ